MGGSQAQAYVRNQLPIIDLNAINDNHVLTTSFLEQVSGIDSVSFEATGVTGTRTLTAQFSHSTDNITYSPYQPITLANMQTITYNANNRAYFKWYFARAGSDTIGIISVKSISLGYTFDRAALSGFGKFTDIGMISEIGQFLKAVIETKCVEYGGANRFEVLEFEDRQRSGGKNNIVLISAIQIGDETAMFTESGDWPITCDLLVKMANPTQGNPQGYSNDYKEMIGILVSIFREDQNSQNRYSFTFKGVSFVNVALADVGPSMFSISHQRPVFDQTTGTTYQRLELKFTIFANRKILG